MEYLQIPSELIAYLTPAFLVGGVTGLIANFAVRQRRIRLKALLIALALLPLVLMSLLWWKSLTGSLRLFAACALITPILFVFAFLGVLLKSGAPMRQFKARFVILIALPIGLACIAQGANYALQKSVVNLRMEEERRQGVIAWNTAERRLQKCVKLLAVNPGDEDAKQSFRSGNRRLRAIGSVGQESQNLYVPGLEFSDADVGIFGFYSFVDGRTEADKTVYRYGVQYSPKGEMWSDPWFRVSNGSGRPPPSASGCEKATMAYLASYNATMLRLGVLRKPAIPFEPPAVPRLEWNVPIGLYANLGDGVRLTDYLTALTAPARKLASVPGVLTHSDIALEEQRSRALVRQIIKGKLLRFDLNGDEIVTKAEFLGAGGHADYWDKKTIFDRYDVNRDDRVSVPEGAKASLANQDRRGDPLPMMELLLNRDPDGDGRLTTLELESLGRSAFSAIDTDGNGVISQTEYEAKIQTIYGNSQRDRKEAYCKYGTKKSCLNERSV